MIDKILKQKNQFWLLVAFALRVYALGAQSLWNDEGNSVALAPRGNDNGHKRIERTKKGLGFSRPTIAVLRFLRDEIVGGERLQFGHAAKVLFVERE